MVGVHSSVDLYRIFRCDPMHLLSLGVSRLLNECTSTMLRDENTCTAAMTITAGASRTFQRVRKSILHQVNIFLRDVEQNSVGHGLHVDFSKGECGYRPSRLFTGTGITGMI